MRSDDLKLAFSPEEFQRASGISKSTFYRAVASGQLRVVKLNRRSLVTRADAERFLASLPELQVA
jgi:hypothetical protein